MIRARVADNWAAFGVCISITDGRGDRPQMVMGLKGRDDGSVYSVWEQIPDDTLATSPTLTLGDDEARALLDALMRHYQGASDMHTVRQDLLHERGRVDKLTEAMIGIATRDRT